MAAYRQANWLSCWPHSHVSLLNMYQIRGKGQIYFHLQSRDNRASCDGSDGLAKGRSSSTSSSSSIEDMLFYETSADGKKGPVLMFSCAALSNPSHTVLGQKFRYVRK